jgi:hypothetical protein
MEKLIIRNESDLEIVDVLSVIKRIISNGRISNDGKQYCYLTSFSVGGKEYHAVSDLNEKSDRFTVYNVKNRAE